QDLDTFSPIPFAYSHSKEAKRPGFRAGYSTFWQNEKNRDSAAFSRVPSISSLKGMTHSHENISTMQHKTVSIKPDLRI
ncbi:MAG: hypothetical protein QM373_08420, partial [Bacillota bacterium]|nr:hypothetical protein [Bacillota bacterium]